MKKVSDKIIVCGPFVFYNDSERFEKAYSEMRDENSFVGKMLKNQSELIVVQVAVMDMINAAEYMHEGPTIFISHKILKNKKLLKCCLIHEYVHFIQDLNIQKNFPGLNQKKLFEGDDFKAFLFYMFLEIDAYLKSNLIYGDNFSESMSVIDFERFFEVYSCKFSNLDYSDGFDFLNMKNSIPNKKEFIKIAECILNTFTGPEYGGEVFSKYNIDWEKMFETFEQIFVLNKNFDKIAKDKKYSSEKMYDFLYRKFNYDDAKRFLLNYKTPDKLNKHLFFMNKKER